MNTNNNNNNNHANNNNPNKFLFTENQIKKIERTISLTKLMSVFPIVFSLWAISFYIAFLVIVKDINLTDYVVPIVVTQFFIFVSSPLIYISFYFFKKFLDKIKMGSVGVTVRNNFQLLKLLLTLEVVFIIGFILMSITIILLYPPVLNPDYSCMDFWQRNYRSWGLNDIAILNMCKTQDLAKKLTIALILTIAVSCFFFSLQLMMALKIAFSWRSFLNSPPRTEFSLLQIKCFGLKTDSHDDIADIEAIPKLM